MPDEDRFGAGDESNDDAVRVPGVPVVSGYDPHGVFTPADEPLELPADDEPVQQRPRATATIRRGTVTATELTKTHRMLIGLVLKGLQARQMSQEEVCRLTGLSAPYVSQLLNGRRTGTMETWDLLLDCANFDYNGMARFTPPDTRTSKGLRRGRKPRA